MAIIFIGGSLPLDAGASAPAPTSASSAASPTDAATFDTPLPGASVMAPKTATPQVTGPLVTSATSYPFNAADHNVSALDLSSYGYVEREYTVSGSANVYAWQGTSLSVGVVSSGPYTTRILVRKPTDPARFTGNVIVELLNPSYAYDLDYIWSADHTYFLAHDGVAQGDAWVGITVSPSSIAALKRFDPARYASLSMANPASVPPTCAVPAGVSPATEPGLEWDVVSQIGALLKGNLAASPLAGLTVQKAYAAGYSTTGNDLVTYVNAFDHLASLPNGMPVYDGYLMGSPAGGPSRLSLCATWFPPGDPHALTQPHRVPIIRVSTQSDFGFWFGAPGVNAIQSTLDRRPDHDAVGDQFRLYEIPGASHLWLYPYNNFPNAAELARIGATVATDGCPEQPGGSFPLHYLLNGAFANLDRWSRYGILPPRGDRITLTNAGTHAEATVLDGWGNARGGVRTPYVDAPINAYVPFSSGVGCAVWGHETPSPPAVVAHVYGGSYVAQVTAATLKLRQQGWVTATDAQRIIAEAVQANVP